MSPVCTRALILSGTFVDPRIIPGFSYRVRVLGGERYLFDGQPVVVNAVGIGYGKRITTSAGHFYSDTYQHGVGFSLQVKIRLGSIHKYFNQFLQISQINLD